MYLWVECNKSLSDLHVYFEASNCERNVDIISYEVLKNSFKAKATFWIVADMHKL